MGVKRNVLVFLSLLFALGGVLLFFLTDYSVYGFVAVLVAFLLQFFRFKIYSLFSSR